MSDLPESTEAGQPELRVESLAEITRSNAEDVAKRLEVLLKADANNGKACIALGYSYYKLQDYAQCALNFHKALYVLKEDCNPDLWYGIALTYKKQHNLKLSETAFLAVLRLNPNYPKKFKVYSELGLIFARENKKDLAIKYFKKAIDLDAGTVAQKVKNLCLFGSMYDKQHSTVKALNVFSQAYGLQKSSETVACLAWAYIRTGRYDHAAQLIYEYFEEYKPDNRVSNLNYLLALCYINIENYSESLKLLQELLSKHPNNCMYLCTAGILFAVTGQFPEAMNYLYRCTSEGPQYEAWYNIGLLYELLNYKEDSLAAYDMAISCSKDNVRALERKTKLGQNKPVDKKDYLYPEVDIVQLFFCKQEDPSADTTEQPAVYHPIVTQMYDCISYISRVAHSKLQKQREAEKFDALEEAQAIQILTELSTSLPIKRRKSSFKVLSRA